MKIISIICYFVGGCLLIADLFSTSKISTRWIGCIALAIIFFGCLLQYYIEKHEQTESDDSDADN